MFCALVLLLMFFHLQPSLQRSYYLPSSFRCRTSSGDPDTYWDSHDTKTKGCEVLGAGNEECGVCTLGTFREKDYNVCFHIKLSWKYDFYDPNGRTGESRDQICQMMDHCALRYAFEYAPKHQGVHEIRDFLKFICGTVVNGQTEKRGTCKSAYGTYICECYNGYQGRDCNDVGPDGSYATGVQVLLDTKVKVSHLMTIIVAVKSKGHDFKVHVSMPHLNGKITITKPTINDPNSKKLIQYCKINTGLGEQCTTYLRGSTAIYTFKLRFPLSRDYNNLWWYALSSDAIGIPIGYTTKLTVTTTNSIYGEEKMSFYRTNYDRSYTMYIQYPKYINCYENPRIDNCDDLKNKVNIYDASNEIVLYGKSPYVELYERYTITCSSHGNETMRWKVYQIMPDGQLSTIVESKAESKLTFVIQPYLFKNGHYIVEFAITMENRFDIAENFDQCFITVVEAPLVAIIDGGNSRYVDVDTVVALDGRRSNDPNLPGKKSKKGLNFKWSCTEKQQGYPCLESYLTSYDYIKLPLYVLEAKKEYMIKLEVTKQGKTSGKTSQTLSTGRMGIAQSIGITCINCMYGNIANPTDYINLLVKVVLKPNVDIELSTLNYTWTFSAHPAYPPDTSVESIRKNQTSQDLLIVEKNTLEENNTYHFRAAIKEDKFIFAEIDIYIPFHGFFTCFVTPESGVVAVTNFNLNCNGTSGITYEVFDKSSSDPDYFSGRMLFTGFDRIDNDFRLANGKVVVYGYNKFKIIYKMSLEVKLTPFDGHLEDIDEMVIKLEHIKNRRQKLLRSTSVIPGALKPDMDWSSINLLKRLIRFVYQIEIEAMEDIKLVLSSMEYILTVLSDTNQTKKFKLEPEVAKMSSRITSSLANNLFERVKELEGQATLTDTILRQMIGSHLNVIEHILTVKNADVLSKPLHLVNPYVLDLVKDTTYELVDALYKLSSCLLWRQIQGYSPTEIVSTASNISEWTVVHTPLSLYHMRRENKSVQFNFSLGFYRTMKNLDVLGIQMTTMKVNPFWWAGGDINTNVLLVDMCFKVNLTQCKYRQTFYKSPIFLYFNISQAYHSIEPLNIHTVYLNLTKDVRGLDMDMTVYRFDPPMRAKLSIVFQFENSKDYKVLFSVNERPDFEMVNKRGVTVNNENQSSVKYLRYIKDDIDKLYYMGIYPVHDGVAGTRANITLKIVYTVCKTWLRWKWGSERCWVGEKETDERTLRCDCNHLSMFAGAVQVPPYTLNPAMEFLLFLTEEFNWLPLTVLIIIILVFIILFIWGRRKDRYDTTTGIVTVLGDNYPGEQFGYLIGVYTGSRINSSTEANVGIKLFGENDSSRAHILKNSNRLILRGNSDDWFLLYSPTHLGTLKSLQTWHDNSGKSPDWFIEKFEVYDLTDKVEYIFELYIWLALGVNEYPDAVVATSSIEDFFSVRRAFISNVVAGYRDTNYWTSIFWKHSRNPVKRVHRACVVLCFIMVAMIVTILIFHFNKGEEYEEDDPSYSLNQTDLLIFIIALIVASFTACLVMFFFRKAFTHNYVRMQSSLFMRPSMTKSTSSSLYSLHQNETVSQLDESTKLAKLSTASLYDSTLPQFIHIPYTNLDERFIRFGVRSKLPRDRSTYERFAAAVHALAHGSSLEPVRLPKYKRNVILHKKYYITAWILCIVIVLAAAVIVILFGHHIPTVEGEKWVTVFLCVLLFDALILSTLKILFCSLILGCVFQRLVPASNYQLKAKDGIQKNLIGDRAHLYKLAQIRSHPMYCPLNERLKEQNRQKCMRREQWKTLIDFLVVLLLIFVLIMLTSLFTLRLYISNAHAARMLTKGPSVNYQNFSNIYNRSLYSAFIFYNLNDQIHRYIWYNENPLNDNDQMRRLSWTYDCTMRLLGNVRIRQVRVVLGECPDVKYFEDMLEYCSPSWSHGVEDTETYGSRWGIGRNEDLRRKSPAWRYTDPAHSNSSVSYGYTLTAYPAGGFIGNLGFEKDLFEFTLSSLFPQHWLDHMTRAVFVELTLYNVNTKLFSQVIIVAEQMPTGEYLVAVKAESVSKDFSFDFWKFTYIVFLVFFLVRMYVLINRQGVFVYFSKIINVFEGFLLALGFLTFVFYLVHLTTSSDYLREFHKSGIDEFFNFYNLISFIFLSRIMLVVLFVCVVIRMLTSFRFGRIYYTFYYTFLLSLPWIVRLSLTLILYLAVIRRLCGFLLSIFVLPNYTTVILYHMERSASGVEDLSYKALLCVMCLSSDIVVLLFIASFVYYYKVAKAYRLIDTDNFNFYLFLKGIVKGRLNKKKDQ